MIKEHAEVKQVSVGGSGRKMQVGERRSGQKCMRPEILPAGFEPATYGS